MQSLVVNIFIVLVVEILVHQPSFKVHAEVILGLPVEPSTTDGPVAEGWGRLVQKNDIELVQRDTEFARQADFQLSPKVF